MIKKDKTKKLALESTINDIFHWKFNNDNDLVVNWDVLKKWSENYNRIISEALEKDKKVLLIITEYTYKEDKKSLWL